MKLHDVELAKMTVREDKFRGSRARGEMEKASRGRVALTRLSGRLLVHLALSGRAEGDVDEAEV